MHPSEKWRKIPGGKFKKVPVLSEAKIVRTGVERGRIDLFTAIEKRDKGSFFPWVCRGKSSKENIRKRPCGLAAVKRKSMRNALVPGRRR